VHLRFQKKVNREGKTEMQMRRWKLALSLGVALTIASACSFTTANIRSLKLYKDKEGTIEADTFAPSDSIYAKAIVANVPSKVTIKFRLITEKVEGQPENAPVPRFDTTVEMPRDGIATYTLSPPTAGWPAGKYRIEAAMLIESGEQKDFKAASYTVSRP
jgi:hypothetical protein